MKLFREDVFDRKTQVLRSTLVMKEKDTKSGFDSSVYVVMKLK